MARPQGTNIDRDWLHTVARIVQDTATRPSRRLDRIHQVLVSAGVIAPPAAPAPPSAPTPTQGTLGDT